MNLGSTWWELKGVAVNTLPTIITERQGHKNGPMIWYINPPYEKLLQFHHMTHKKVHPSLSGTNAYLYSMLQQQTCSLHLAEHGDCLIDSYGDDEGNEDNSNSWKLQFERKHFKATLSSVDAHVVHSVCMQLMCKMNALEQATIRMHVTHHRRVRKDGILSNSRPVHY